jgi:hypothetical protein
MVWFSGGTNLMKEASMQEIETAICYSVDSPNGAGGWRGTGTKMSGYGLG